MGKITEQEITKQITKLINDNVSKITNDDNKWKNHYEIVMSELEDEIKNTEELIGDFTESKLSINLIEQEGYLRCLRTMYNRFRIFEE